MSFGSWIKNIFLEEDTKNLEGADLQELKKDENERSEEIYDKNFDYNLKIFDLVKKGEVSKITNYIVDNKALALIKMHKFTGNKDDLKEVLNELKQACDACNSKIIGITNNMYFITKHSVNIEKENNGL